MSRKPLLSDDERLRRARERSRRWRAENPEKMRACRERWRAAHPERVKEYYRRATRKKEPGRVLKTYGLNHQQWLSLFEASDGLCAICVSAPAENVDHDHAT